MSWPFRRSATAAVDLADAALREAARHAANRQQFGRPLARSGPVAQLLAATEAAARVVDRCVQVMGRWGLIHGSIVERAYRSARPLRIYEGASEVLKLGVARALCDEVAAG
jgi:acyl-CoA dehydrogenase